MQNTTVQSHTCAFFKQCSKYFGGETWKAYFNAKLKKKEYGGILYIKCNILLQKNCGFCQISGIFIMSNFVNHSCCTPAIFFLKRQFFYTIFCPHNFFHITLTSSIFLIQFLMLSNDFSLVMSYTSIIPYSHKINYNKYFNKFISHCKL